MFTVNVTNWTNATWLDTFEMQWFKFSKSEPSWFLLLILILPFYSHAFPCTLHFFSELNHSEAFANSAHKQNLATTNVTNPTASKSLHMLTRLVTNTQLYQYLKHSRSKSSHVVNMSKVPAKVFVKLPPIIWCGISKAPAVPASFGRWKEIPNRVSCSNTTAYRPPLLTLHVHLDSFSALSNYRSQKRSWTPPVFPWE